MTSLRTGLLRLTGGTTIGAFALGIVVLVVLVAIVGPYVAPHGPSDIVGPPFQPAGDYGPLGTDFLGRDVWSRLLSGGRTTIIVASMATLGSTVIGGTAGLVAGFVGGRVDEVLMRTVDVLLAFPPMLFLLVLASGLGPSVWMLWASITIIFSPGVARVARTATQTVRHAGYVEAAVARGESTGRIMFREILPNIRGTLLADAGPRLTFAILLVAAVNYLGLGLRPPAADWALMISENRSGLGLQAWAVASPALVIALLTVGVNIVADHVDARPGRPVPKADAHG